MYVLRQSNWFVTGFFLPLSYYIAPSPRSVWCQLPQVGIRRRACVCVHGSFVVVVVVVVVVVRSCIACSLMCVRVEWKNEWGCVHVRTHKHTAGQW